MKSEDGEFPPCGYFSDLNKFYGEKLEIVIKFKSSHSLSFC